MRALSVILMAVSCALPAVGSPPSPVPLPNYQLAPTDHGPDFSTWAIPQPQSAPKTLAQAAAPRQIAPAAAGQCQVMKLRVLTLIYTNTCGGTVSQAQIDKLKLEVDEARTFYWRNSRMRCYIENTYLILDTYKDITEFWDFYNNNSYWLTFWDNDSDGESVENDLRANGVANNQYSGVFVYYAWGQNGYAAAIGGGTYGVDIGFLGQTAYCSVPLCWDPNTNDWYFIHEFNHAVDSMFLYSGHAEYAHADDPIHMPGDFGEDYDFNRQIMRDCGYWLEMNSPWGSVIAFPDADEDGFPDSGAGLPFAEASFGSSPSSADTDSDDLSDVGEATAGMLGGSNPNLADSDSDSISDSLDKYPIYPVDDYIHHNTMTVDGNIEAGWHTIGSTTSGAFSSTFYADWDTNYLYLAFRFNKWNWTRIHLDCVNNGWFHGSDNYEMTFTPNSGTALWSARVLDCTSGSAVWRTDLAPASSILYRGAWVGGYYNAELRIPRNALTDLLPGPGKAIGVSIRYSNIDGAGVEATPFERDALVDLTMLDTTSLFRDPTVAVTKARADGAAAELAGKRVSAVFSDCFYISEADRSSGIRVALPAAPVAEGDRVRVTGMLGVSAFGERELQSPVVEQIPER